MHAVKVACESIDVSGPESAKLREPHIHLPQWFRPQTVETALRVDGGFYEASVAQHAQVLGHGGLRHPQLTLDFPYGLFGQDQQAQDRAAVGLGNDFEGGFHSLYIPHNTYTCQGIYD